MTGSTTMEKDAQGVDSGRDDAESSATTLSSSSKQGVRFSSESAVFEVDNFTKTDVSKFMWYTPAEIFLMMKEAKRTADLMEEKARKLKGRTTLHRMMRRAMVFGRCGTKSTPVPNDDDEEEDEDDRGLETVRVDAAIQRRRGVIREVVTAVIVEQERQKHHGTLDPEKIANAATSKGSTRNMTYALQVGAQDELKASEVHAAKKLPQSQQQQKQEPQRSPTKRKVVPRQMVARNQWF